MEKVKITREQSIALKLYKQGEGSDIGYFCKNRGDFRHGYISLNDFSVEQFALMLCGWYEVEQPFKVGDWVKRVNSDIYVKVKNPLFANTIGDYEKVTEPWKIKLLELGRDKPEIRIGDRITDKEDNTFPVIRGGWSIEERKEIKYIYPVESRIEL